jgi:hypothetical protein
LSLWPMWVGLLAFLRMSMVSKWCFKFACFQSFSCALQIEVLDTFTPVTKSLSSRAPPWVVIPALPIPTQIWQWKQFIHLASST